MNQNNMPIYAHIDINNPPTVDEDERKIADEQVVRFNVISDYFVDKSITLKYRLGLVAVNGDISQEYDYFIDSNGDDITTVETVSAYGSINVTRYGLIIPTGTENAADYGIIIELYNTGYSTIHQKEITPVGFAVVSDKTGSDLIKFTLIDINNTECDISGTDVTAVVPDGTTITGINCSWIISQGAVLSVAAADQDSGDCSLNVASLVLKVTAQDSSSTDYDLAVTISDGPDAGAWDFNGYSSKTSISPTTVGMGRVLSIIFTCLNDGTGDYDGDEGHRIPVNFYTQGAVVDVEDVILGARYRIVASGTTDFSVMGSGSNNVGAEFVAIAVGTGTGTVRLFVEFGFYIELTKAIPKEPIPLGAPPYSFTEFRKDVIIPTWLQIYGATYTITFVTDGSVSDITKTVTIVKQINATKTKIYSEKDSLFLGNRSYLSPSYFAINNDLFGSNPTNNREFYLMDSNNTVNLWGKVTSESWSVTFVVQVGVDPVIFKTLDIELAKIDTGSVELKKIEYSTNRQDVVQDPFYSSTGSEWNPWNPVFKDEKWHLSIKNEFVEDDLIEYKKLKGTYLRITLTGQSDDQIVLRNVVTKILKIFN